jgi:GR25 family glycosyltransferase involved in LPS biosynthesis
VPKVSEEEIQILVASGNFDAQWYLEEYPDVATTGMRPEEHYLWIGQTLNRKTCANPRRSSAPLNWCVMTTLHTLFLANMIASSLRRHGWVVDVRTEAPEQFSHDHYIVLCAQMFERLPPSERRTCYQLEQSVSSRWFNSDYLSILENSLAVLDYSLTNIEFLAGNGIVYPHVFYLPVGARNDFAGAELREKHYDLLFYGDYKSSPRRRRFLDAIQNQYKVKVVDEAFGNDIHDLIRQSKFVLNLHYYEGALLEMPRVQECLSLGTPVISEGTSDAASYPHLNDAVTFFEEGSIKDMKRVIALAVAKGQNTEAVRASVESSQRHFDFMLDRFLVAKDFLPMWKLDELELPDVFDSRIVGLSLPETVKRRRMFEAESIRDCAIFDGMRKSPGWIGCGISYKVLCTEALKRGKEQLIVLEDDVDIDEQFESNFAIVERYLKKITGEWDVFSGVIASLHDNVTVSKVEHFEGVDFVTIDKMTSMVFNIYNRKAMHLIANWSPNHAHVETNAIDRYLEHADLKVVVAHPYIAGHRTEVHSTLWNFQNTQYVDMIQESENRLGHLKDAWLAKHPLALVA